MSDASVPRSATDRGGVGRWLYVAAGLAALLLGLAEITVGVIPFALNRPIVYLVSGLALVLAYRVARARWREETVEAGTPDPELVARAPVPGEDLRDALASVPAVRQSRYRPMLRESLGDVVVGALVRYTNADEETARRRLEEGTWTEAADLAGFLRGDPVTATLGSRLRQVVTGESVYGRRIRRTVAEIGSIVGVEPLAGPAPGDGVRERIRAIRERGDAADDPGTTDGDRQGDGTGSGDGGAGTGLAWREHTVPLDATPLEGRPTNRWRGVGAVALLCVGVGVLYQRPGVVLAGVAAVGFVAYGRTGRAPEPDLRVERTLASERPAPGEPVTVTVRVRNDGDASLPDLRLVDGVPAALGVVEGSPRLGTALRPGETATLEYAVGARRGVHEFGPTVAVCRDLAGTAEGTAVQSASATLVCRPPFRATTGTVPLREHTTLSGGKVATSTGGSGVEFHATREYRPGDPLNRVDWNRRARTGEFATLEFREERSATVVVVVDARPPAYCSPGTDDHAVDRAVQAAGRIGARLLADGHRVGLAAFGARECWLAPGSGRDHGDRLRDRLATASALAPVPESIPGGSEWRRRLRQRLSSDAQLLVCSPLVDRESARHVREFNAYGYPVTTVSPDPTRTDEPGRVLAHVGRRFRITDLRRAGLPVVDWAWDDSLDATLERYAEVDR